MNVRFWGVRGSIPTPGSGSTRWGGNSSCVELRCEGHPPVILDCGTGARRLGQSLLSESHRALDLFFSHLHMDHLFGLPFFVPLYTPGYALTVRVPSYSPEDARQKLGRYMNGTYHPVRLREVPASIDFAPVKPGAAFKAAGYSVTTFRLNHPGGATAYRFDAHGQSVAYISDTAPFALPGEGVGSGKEPTNRETRMLAFLAGCDLVIYDTMYELDEYLEKMTWGHSYPEYAYELCKAASVKRLVLFHHSPDATDEELDARKARFSAHTSPSVTLAREGQAISVRD